MGKWDKDNLLNAFKLFSKDEASIPLEKLAQVLLTYDKKYKSSVVKNIKYS